MPDSRNQRAASLVPWLATLAVTAVAGVVIFQLWSAHQAQRLELARLQAELKELETLRAGAREIPRLRAAAEGMEAMKKDVGDLPRLRGEVSRLRAGQQQLVKAQAEVQRLQSVVQQQQIQAGPSSAAQPAALPALPGGAPVSAEVQVAQGRALHDACIANLKQLDGAKATWALENRKTGLDVPTDSDLFGPQLYVREKPVCPANGSYLLNPVDTRPTCTVHGNPLGQ